VSEMKYRYQLYQRLHAATPQIFADARAAADDIGLRPEWRGQIGLTGAISSCHALLRREVRRAMDEAADRIVENKYLADELREIVKDVYGDGYDAAPINTCEAALWLSFDALATPPMLGRGDTYRARYIAPYERHVHHQAGYGRPFPAKYKDVIAERGVTSGELGMQGKRLNDLDVVLVRLEGARYESHGIRYFPAPLLADVDASGSIARIAEAARRHGAMLTAFASLGYDTPGYGYGEHDAEGAPRLAKGIGQLAAMYDVPYIVDNAIGVPFMGTDPRAIGADVMVYSMDKVAGAPTGGLIVGREEAMIPIRRALGIHGERGGNPLSYGKAAYVTFDAGKEYLIGLLAALRTLRDRPEVIAGPLARAEAIVREEFGRLAAGLREGIVITRSINGAAIEVNYQGTWRGGRTGIPIFTIEDMYAGTSLLQSGMAQMGIVPTVAYDGNILITLGLGTTDEDGALLEDRFRVAVRGLVRLIEIVCAHGGVTAPEPALARSA
jgi:hypothetical protein